MSILKKLTSAHMPFLFSTGGAVGMLFCQDTGSREIAPNLADSSVFFREPWLSNPGFDAQRKVVAEKVKPNTQTIWKTARLASLASTPESIPQDSDDSVECSPYLVDGSIQFIRTSGLQSTRGGGMLLPSWAGFPYGWSQSDGLQVWCVDRHALSFGWQQNGGPVTTVRLFGLPSTSILTRVAPVFDRPGLALVTVDNEGRDPHTFAVKLQDQPTMQELLAAGQPVYKSSTLGNLCAYTARNEQEHTIYITNNFQEVPVKPGVLIARL